MLILDNRIADDLLMIERVFVVELFAFGEHLLVIRRTAGIKQQLGVDRLGLCAAAFFQRSKERLGLLIVGDLVDLELLGKFLLGQIKRIVRRFDH